MIYLNQTPLQPRERIMLMQVLLCLLYGFSRSPPAY